MNARQFSDPPRGIRVDFKQNFAEVNGRLYLHLKLSPVELASLHVAAFRAALCNIAFNGLGGCEGKIKPEREEHRRNLEVQLMAARNCLFASEGWAGLPSEDKTDIKSRLLTVQVADRNLAN